MVDAIRDAAVRRVTEHPSETAGIASQLLGLAQGVLKGIGLYVLAVSGDAAPELLSRVVTDPGYFADIQLHHEFYQLVQQRFGQLTTADQARYIALVDEVAKAKTADDSQKDAERRQKWWVWNRLGAVSAYLSGVDKERIEAIQAELGPEDHPDLLSYHQTWSGPTSPVSKTALADMQIDELITFLEEWVPDSESFHPGPSRDGLARELGDIAKADPTRYAPIATQLMRLRPVYAGSYLFGLREAVEGTVEFDVGPVVELCRQVVERTSGVEVPVPQGEDDDSWASIRINVARFLEAVLDRRRDGRAPALQVDPDQMVLRTIIAISHDPDPTPEAEARFGPPNMDGLTYSLNTTRGQAMHAALSYLWWSYRQAPDSAAWSLSADLPLLAPLLDSHLSAEHDPSVAIGAAFGWWLSKLIAADAAWISPRVPELLGDLSTPRQQAAWGAYLMRSRPGKRNYDALQGVYEQYARQLASLDEAPKSSRAAADPVDHAIDHLLLLALHGDLGLDAGPLDEMLRARKPWLTKAIAEEARRLAHRTPEIEDAIDQGFQRLWARIRTEAEDAPRGPLRDALGEFAWWFASSLRSTWTLPELVRLLGLHVVVDPEFLVLPRLAELAPTEPSQTIQALWLMTPPSDDEWAFRTYDDEIGKVLAIGIASDDELLRERSRSLVDRFVRLGLRGLKRLVAAPAPEAEALPD